MRRRRFRICFLYGLLVSTSGTFSTTRYVATSGQDTNIGTLDSPLATLAKAITLSSAGDTILVRAGTYGMTSTLAISKSGQAEKKYSLLAFSDERPVLDFSMQSTGSRGISLKASHWYIRGLDIKGAGDNGMEISAGSYNRIEGCNFFENRDSGLQLSNGASYNQIVNCDSYLNADPPDYGDADGFAPKLTVGTGNFFFGCRAWANCDDGWDGYMRGATNVTTTLEQCWTWGNGYLKDGSDPGEQANGNGFKMGGGDNSNSARLMHHFILKNCLAFNNKAKGFDQNNNVGSMSLINCTGYGNRTDNYRITKTLNVGETLTVINCVSYNGGVSLAGFAQQKTNSWLVPFSVTAKDFISVDASAAADPRQQDGRLPEITFLHLAEGSDLIDAGVGAELAFHGLAPDLGAFESSFSTFIARTELEPSWFSLSQNYPNPFNPSTTIRYQLASPSLITLKVYSLSGQEIAELANGYQSAGEYSATWRPHLMAAGVYFYRLQAGRYVEIKKMVLGK